MQQHGKRGRLYAAVQEYTNGDFAGLGFVILVSFLFLLATPAEELRPILAEDGIVENIGAATYFLAAVGFFGCHGKIEKGLPLGFG